MLENLIDINNLFLMSGILGFLNAGDDAAEAQVAANMAAINEQRRQFDQTTQNLSPFLEAGQRAVPGLEQASTVQGLGERLSQIFSGDFFNRLLEESTRSAQGQLSAGGLTRSGTAVSEMARLPLDLGLAIEQLLTGRLGGLAASGQNAGAQLGSFGQNSANSISSLLQDTGRARSSGILLDAGTEKGIFEQLLPIGGQFLQSLLPVGGAAAGGAALSAGTAAGAGSAMLPGAAVASLFSDGRLKRNAVKISEVNGLNYYEWEWIPEVKGTMVEKCPNKGFMADEVEKRYPHHVAELYGFKIINYPALLSELEYELKEAA